MKNDQSPLPTQDIIKLIELIDKLLVDIKTANVTSVTMLRKFDTTIDELIGLDIDNKYLSSPDWNLDTSSKYVLRQKAKKVTDDARLAKSLLRKAALKSFAVSGEEKKFLGKVIVILTDVKFSLIHIHSELFGIKNLPLFNFANRTLR